MKRIATLLGITLLTALPLTQAAAQQAAPSTQHAVLVGSDSLVGSTVRNPDGHDIGKVSRLMIDPNDGRITSIVISTGGKLGLSSDTLSVPWNSVKIGQDQGKVVVIAQQTLDSAPKAEREAPKTDREKASAPANTPDSQPRKQ